MQIKQLKIGSYKVPRTEKLKIMMYDGGEYQEVSMATSTLRVFKINKKSVRAAIEYRDKNKAVKVGRLDFDLNKGDYQLEAI